MISNTFFNMNSNTFFNMNSNKNILEYFELFNQSPKNLVNNTQNIYYGYKSCGNNLMLTF